MTMNRIALIVCYIGTLPKYFQYFVDPDPICYVYHDGVLTDLSNGQEFMYIHLNHVKNDWKFFIPPISRLPSKFRVFPEGIIPGLPGELLSKLKWQVGKTLFSLNYLLRRVKKKALSRVIN